MEALVKVVVENGEPEVLLGVQAMAVQQDVVGEPVWTKCANPAISDIALEEYKMRQ